MLGGLVLGLGALFGWNEWRDYQDTQAGQASDLYENIRGAISNNRTARADILIADMAAAYGGSPYLDQARLLMAKSNIERSEFDAAADYLSRILADSDGEEIRHIARLRLARVRLQQQRLDAALSVVGEIGSETVFVARYHDLRGDILFAMERPDDARNEYQLALSFAEQPPVIDRIYVQAKLDDLGVASVASLDALPDEGNEGNEGDPAYAE